MSGRTNRQRRASRDLERSTSDNKNVGTAAIGCPSTVARLLLSRDIVLMARFILDIVKW